MEQDLGLQGITLVGQRGHDGLDLHGSNVPQAVAAQNGRNLVVQRILDGILTLFTQIWFL